MAVETGSSSFHMISVYSGLIEGVEDAEEDYDYGNGKGDVDYNVENGVKSGLRGCLLTKA